jgi:hypothetical protein
MSRGPFAACHPRPSGLRDCPYVMDTAWVTIMLIIVAGAAVSAVVQLFQSYLERRLDERLSGPPRPPVFEERIAEMTHSLNQAVRLGSEIQDEIRQRQRALTELQAQSEEHQRLVNINREEAEAVAHVLRDAARASEGGRSGWAWP